MVWFFLTLVTALTQAVKDAYLKKSLSDMDAGVGMLVYTAIAAVFLWLGAAANPMPTLGPSFWPLLIGGGLLGGLTYFLYGRALKVGDLSLALPMLAFTPLFLLGTSPLTVGEYPGPAGVCGVVLVAVGAYVLNLRERKYGIWGPVKALFTNAGSRLMLMVAAVWSVGANLDKLGLQASSPAYWAAAIYTATGAALLAAVAVRFRHGFSLPANARRGLVAAGLLEAVGLYCQMHALPLTQVAYVISVKRLSIVFAVLIGAVFFREPDLVHRLPGALLMVAGVSFIAVFG
ncbi:MAG: EamA family transporter [Solidesulfovibrio sp.]